MWDPEGRKAVAKVIFFFGTARLSGKSCSWLFSLFRLSLLGLEVFLKLKMQNIMKLKAIIVMFVALAYVSVSYAQDWAKFGRYQEQNVQVGARPRAVFMGDSITDNWAKKDGDFFADNNFLGRGISGQTTSHMLVRFRRDVIDLGPKYVVILAGTNDIAKNNGDISLENILGNIISMCELAKANRIRPVLCSVLPAAAYRWRPAVRPAEDIVKLNEMIRSYAEANRIPYVDYHSVLKDDQGGLPMEHAADGVHPNLDCYKIMEKIILRYL